MSWQKELADDYSLDQPMVASLELLLRLLQEKADRNLTAVTSTASIIALHFRDSLALLTLPEVAAAESIVDIGSGAGFPGLPLAISRPGVSMTLVETNQGKCEFMADFVRRSGIANVTITAARAETVGRGDLRDHFDLALARAVGPLALTMEYAAPLVKTGGFLVLQRGETRPGDEPAAHAAAEALSLSLVRIEPMYPYPEAKNLHAWVFRKEGATASGFPRKPGIAKKRPLA